MPAILDPWHSRPMDVHRWSDHPGAAQMVTQIWQQHFNSTQQQRGPKPRTPFQDQLKVLLLDLFVAWKEDPQLSIGLSMSANAYNTGSRYNALRISKHMINVVRTLQDAGLIDLARGSYGGAGVGGNRTTRIRASDRLQTVFQQSTLTREAIQRAPEQECIILRGVDERLVEYEDTWTTNRQRAELQAYNALLLNNHIDIGTLSTPVVEREGANRQHIGRDYHFMRRIFSRGDWSCNGRFYGGWWQLIDKGLREHILINDKPTVEVDFRAMHVQILHAQEGSDLPEDPYRLPHNSVPGTPAILQRALAKRLVLTALNARDRASAYRSFRNEWPNGHMGRNMTDGDLDRLMRALLHANPLLGEHVFADRGIHLMNLDAKIAELIHRHFTEQGIVVLSVHDSFIVDYAYAGQLRQAMATASDAIVGCPLPVTQEGVGLDEIDPEMRQDLITWREERTERCQEYLSRWDAWTSTLAEKGEGPEAPPPPATD